MIIPLHGTIIPQAGTIIPQSGITFWANEGKNSYRSDSHIVEKKESFYFRAFRPSVLAERTNEGRESQKLFYKYTPPLQ